MTLTRIDAKLLSVRVLPNADARLCAALGLPQVTKGASLALLTCDQDDSLYAALDHATKMAPVQVIYAKSFYAGSAHASGPNSGEILGVLAANDPDEIEQGVKAVRTALTDLFSFYSVDSSGVTLFPTVIASVGHYLAGLAKVPVGSALGYFIAPPLEATFAVDAALKAANVELKHFFGPPTETNFAGCYVSGELDAVQAAAEAFTEAVSQIAARPLGTL